jgi:hypothetical protein
MSPAVTAAFANDVTGLTDTKVHLTAESSAELRLAMAGLLQSRLNSGACLTNTDVLSMVAVQITASPLRFTHFSDAHHQLTPCTFFGVHCTVPAVYTVGEEGSLLCDAVGEASGSLHWSGIPHQWCPTMGNIALSRADTPMSGEDRCYADFTIISVRISANTGVHTV